MAQRRLWRLAQAMKDTPYSRQWMAAEHPVVDDVI
jgi:hypothetical protein